jgi:hypothetical protein
MNLFIHRYQFLRGEISFDLRELDHLYTHCIQMCRGKIYDLCVSRDKNTNFNGCQSKYNLNANIVNLKQILSLFCQHE